MIDQKALLDLANVFLQSPKGKDLVAKAEAAKAQASGALPPGVTVEDVKNTIAKLEKLYKAKKYPHKRIWQVGMIMKVRLEVLKNSKSQQYKLASKYFKFLGKRTKLNESERYSLVFKN